MKINEHYSELKASYLFRDIAQKTAAYKEAHPEADIIRMGIGDVTLPLCKASVIAMIEASAEMEYKKNHGHYYPLGTTLDSDAMKGDVAL